MAERATPRPERPSFSGGSNSRMLTASPRLTLVADMASFDASVIAHAEALVWLPAVSAIAGAAVGGIATYWSNRALDNRRERAEAARWRKENVYIPIREELLGLKAAAGDEIHLNWGISFKPAGPEGGNRVVLHLWQRFTRELRAKSYATAKVQRRLDAVDRSARLFNEARAENIPLLEKAGAAVIQEHDLGDHPRNWLVAGFTRQVLRDEMTLEHLFGHPEAVRTDARASFVSHFNAREDVKRARAKVLDAERQLLSDATVAVTELEASIQKVAEKFETPPKY